jgi:hypothetical protein
VCGGAAILACAERAGEQTDPAPRQSVGHHRSDVPASGTMVVGVLTLAGLSLTCCGDALEHTKRQAYTYNCLLQGADAPNGILTHGARATQRPPRGPAKVPVERRLGRPTKLTHGEVTPWTRSLTHRYIYTRYQTEWMATCVETDLTQRGVVASQQI